MIPSSWRVHACSAAAERVPAPSNLLPPCSAFPPALSRSAAAVQRGLDGAGGRAPAAALSLVSRRPRCCCCCVTHLFAF